MMGTVTLLRMRAVLGMSCLKLCKCKFLLLCSVENRVAVVQFSLVQGYISLNPELDRRSSSGKSLNPNLNQKERFRWSSSGSYPLQT